MSQPPDPYARQYNFAGWSANNPTTPHQGNKLDQEYNAILASLNQTISRLGEIQKDDGKLRANSLDLADVAEFVDSTAVDAANAAAESAADALSSKNDAAASAADAAESAASVNASAINAALAGKAPLVHTHAIADVTNLQTTLDGKAGSSHTHPISDVSGLQAALDGKAASGHTHAQSEVTGLEAALASKVETTSQQIAKAWVSFDGTTTPPTIKASYNVASVSRSTTGVYTINFTAAFADTNYCWMGGARGTGASYYMVYQSTAGNSQTTSALTVVTASASAPVNCSLVNVAVFR